MTERVKASNLPPAHDVECGRQMVDAMRAILGLDPLYAAISESSGRKTVYSFESGSLGDGNYRRPPRSNSF